MHTPLLSGGGQVRPRSALRRTRSRSHEQFETDLEASHGRSKTVQALTTNEEKAGSRVAHGRDRSGEPARYPRQRQPAEGEIACPRVGDVAAANHNVQVAADHRRVEQRQKVWRVAEIRVHDANNVAGGEREPVQNGAAQPELVRPMDHVNAAASRPLLRAVTGSIARVVVDDDHLDIHPVVVGNPKDPLEEPIEAVALIVGGDDERQIRARHRKPPMGGVAWVRLNSWRLVSTRTSALSAWASMRRAPSSDAVSRWRSGSLSGARARPSRHVWRALSRWSSRK